MLNWTITAISVVTVTSMPLNCSYHVIKTTPASYVLKITAEMWSFGMFFFYYIWMLSKRVAIRVFRYLLSPNPQWTVQYALREHPERHMSATPASFLHKIMWEQRSSRLEKSTHGWRRTAQHLHNNTHYYRSVQSVTGWWGVGKSSCSLDTAPVWADKGCAGKVVWDLRWSGTNCNRRVGT